MKTRLTDISLFLLFCFGLIAKAGATVVSVPFEIKDGLILIDASINGERGAYIFDTGSADILINSGNHNGSIEMITTKGIVSAKEIDITTIEIGELIIAGQKGLQLDMSDLAPNVHDHDIKGLIGWSVLGDRAIIIDYEERVIKVNQKHLDMTREELATKHIMKLNIDYMLSDLPVVNVAIGEESYNFAFDTGAAANVIDRGISGQKKGWFKSKWVSHNLSFENGTRLKNAPMLAADLSSFRDELKSKDLHGILSVNGLEADIVIIDRSNHRIYVIWDKDKLSGGAYASK